MPFKYVILNLRKWRKALVCIKKARKANKKTHLSDEIEGCVTQLETTGTETLYECKNTIPFYTFVCFLERFTILNMNPVCKYYYTATDFWFSPVVETEREIQTAKYFWN